MTFFHLFLLSVCCLWLFLFCLYVGECFFVFLFLQFAFFFTIFATQKYVGGASIVKCVL